MTWTIAALYRFVPIDDLPELRDRLSTVCASQGACGTILLAREGINGTIAGSPSALEAILDFLDERVSIRLGEVKFSTSVEKPFGRMKVRIRPEIITMRAPDADPSRQVGTYVEPADWNALIADPDTLVLDTRNRYETRLGTFQDAVDPQIDTFTEFKEFVERELYPERHRRIAMFCTGGIRCEKASSYLLAHGFEDVRHLKGGILKYLETIPNELSRWQGDCYVFDHRTAVGPALSSTEWNACFGCGSPLSEKDRNASSYEVGVSCPRCSPTLTAERARSLRERHRQMISSKKPVDVS